LPAVLQALITFAAEEAEGSKTAFYVIGGALAAFAVVVSAIGIRGHETFPSSMRAYRAVLGLAIVLVAGAMATAVLTG
jgi:hypothetical protein